MKRDAGGKVTKLGADFIGMTVLGTLNAAIGRQNIRPELTYSHQASESTCSCQYSLCLLLARDSTRLASKHSCN